MVKLMEIDQTKQVKQTPKHEKSEINPELKLGSHMCRMLQCTQPVWSSEQMLVLLTEIFLRATPSVLWQLLWQGASSAERQASIHKLQCHDWQWPAH